MEIEIVFNELCLLTPSIDINTARQLMSDFINTIIAIKPPSGIKKKLRTQSNFNDLQLAQDYLIAQWRNDPDVDIEARRLIRSLQNRNDPPLPDIADPEIEVMYKGQQTIGICYAYVSNSLAISLQSELHWKASNLEIQVTKINEEEQLVTNNDNVLHASCTSHVQEHYNWIQDIQERICQQVADGEDIWKRKEELFPNLEFCEVVGRQLKNIRTRQLELQPVFKILYELQQCTENWKTGSFNVKGYALEESGESEATLNQYKNERMFLCPDGEKRLFEKHIKLRFCNWRIHFFPKEPGRVIIGYVGRHLPTVKYKT
ncbi:hypothetical protein [Nostoc sp. FACHB-190]|uniref:hypothetical protein n=1 Tax=Nostoc sp. FACHB-190 TaxID=2692838 RepID=UPI001688C771|nr:hypothetical protein [Nostoc sp. FACHB-190]MBD2299891.1 hypothetical protein [Nostoc sp. FACHB-190]